MHWKSFAGISSILLFSFFWGYRGKDAFAEWTSSVRSWWTASEAPPIVAAAPAPAAHTGDVLPGSGPALYPGPKVGSQAAALVPQTAPGIPSVGVPIGSRPPFPPAGTTGRLPSSGFNPQAANAPGMPPVPPGPQGNALANTLDAIRPGQIAPDQIARRNEYFQRLSQQLRDANANGAVANGGAALQPPPSVPLQAPGGPFVVGGGPGGAIQPDNGAGSNFPGPPPIAPPYDSMPDGGANGVAPAPPSDGDFANNGISQQTGGAVEELEEDDSEDEITDEDEPEDPEDSEDLDEEPE